MVTIRNLLRGSAEGIELGYARIRRVYIEMSKVDIW